MDWETFYFEYWVYVHPEKDPTAEDYLEWLYDKADLALGDG
jgi:hypothetical protein